MYISIIHHLYFVLCVHHPKSCLFPSPFILPLPSPTSPCPPFPLVKTILLSVSEVWFSLNPFTFFTQSHYPLPSDSCHSVFFIYESYTENFCIECHKQEPVIFVKMGFVTFAVKGWYSLSFPFTLVLRETLWETSRWQEFLGMCVCVCERERERGNFEVTERVNIAEI